MTRETLCNALAHIDDTLIQRSENGTAHSTRVWVKITAVAACLCLTVGALWAFGRKKNEWTPMLTVYASDGENELPLGKFGDSSEFPIRCFSIDEENNAFVFSYENIEPNTAVGVKQYALSKSYNTAFRKTLDFTEKSGNIYVYLIAPKEKSPCIFRITEIGLYKAYAFGMKITQREGQYFCTLCPQENCPDNASGDPYFVNAESIADVPSEELQPIQAAIDEVNAACGTTLYIPEQQEGLVYNAYKDFSPEEMRERLRRSVSE